MAEHEYDDDSRVGRSYPESVGEGEGEEEGEGEGELEDESRS